MSCVTTTVATPRVRETARTTSTVSSLLPSSTTITSSGCGLHSQRAARQFKVSRIGETDEVKEQFYAISVERRISHPAVAAITETAREWLA